MHIEQLSPDSRIWVYQSSREFTPDEENEIKIRCQQLVNHWASHGKGMQAAYAVKHHRFIILGVDEKKFTASGCSIDSSVSLIKKLETEYSLSLTGRMEIAFLENDNTIKIYSIHALPELMKAGKIQPESRFFNNLVACRSDWEQNWITPVRGSWLERFALQIQ